MAPRACTDERVRTVMSPEISSCEHIDHLKHSIAISCKMKKKSLLMLHVTMFACGVRRHFHLTAFALSPESDSQSARRLMSAGKLHSWCRFLNSDIISC